MFEHSMVNIVGPAQLNLTQVGSDHILGQTTPPHSLPLIAAYYIHFVRGVGKLEGKEVTHLGGFLRSFEKFLAVSLHFKDIL